MSNFFNDKVALSSDKQDWETPQQLFSKLNEKYHFNWDLAANDVNHKCDHYITPEQDSLQVDWSLLDGWLFLNPPYGRDMKKWIRKAYLSAIAKKNGGIVLVIPSRTGTSYWHDYIFGKAEIEFLRGRLHFEFNGNPGAPAPFDSAIIVYHAGDNKRKEGTGIENNN